MPLEEMRVQVQGMGDCWMKYMCAPNLYKTNAIVFSVYFC